MVADNDQFAVLQGSRRNGITTRSGRSLKIPGWGHQNIRGHYTLLLLISIIPGRGGGGCRVLQGLIARLTRRVFPGLSAKENIGALIIAYTILGFLL